MPCVFSPLRRLALMSLVLVGGGLIAAPVNGETKGDQAHWEKGEVRWFQQWVSLDKVPALAEAHRNIAQYEKIRGNYAKSAEGQFALAEWCRQRGLKDQERAHLTVVLDFDPDHAPARERLGFVRNGSGWTSQSEQKAVVAQARADEAAVRRWGSKVFAWRKALEGNIPVARTQMLAQIREIRDVSAIMPLERVVSTISGDEAGLAVVTALAKIDDDAATFSLARHAAFHDSEAVRSAATQALKSRTLEVFVPPMLSAMFTPVEMQTEVTVGQGGSIIVSQTFTREGQTQRQESQVQTTIVLGGNDTDTRARAEEDAQKTAETNAKKAEEENQRTQFVNQRVSAVLASVSDTDLPADPEMWWRWWRDRNEVFSGQKPTRRRYLFDEHFIEPPTPPFEEFDCLAQGTEVWTSSGPKAIETIQVGDLVLAQNPETGELAYKPVLATTVRPVSLLTRMEVDGESIRTSGGHPIWVDGRGWVKARHVASGDPLFGVDGRAYVESAQPDDRLQTYNLIVADFHTYFIGRARILSHDNTPCGVTRNGRPGAKR